MPVTPHPLGDVEHIARNRRQCAVLDWAVDSFGDAANDPGTRALRFLEEAIELYQAVCADTVTSFDPTEKAHQLVDAKMSERPGDIHQELGGVALTTMALAQVCAESSAVCEQDEYARVLAKPRDHWPAREATKRAAGF